jgi:hypothetical protein
MYPLDAGGCDAMRAQRWIQPGSSRGIDRLVCPMGGEILAADGFAEGFDIGVNVAEVAGRMSCGGGTFVGLSARQDPSVGNSAYWRAGRTRFA